MKILITGANGLVGSAIMRRLKTEPTIETVAITRTELDLLDEQATSAYLERLKPEVVIAAAAVVPVTFNYFFSSLNPLVISLFS